VRSGFLGARGAPAARRLGFALLALALSASPALASVCALPGNDGSLSISGVVNTYFAAAAGTYGPASSSIALTDRQGAAPNIGPGDLVLVIQMQCATIDFSDSLAYGSGVNAEPASGYVDPVGSCLAGRHEYVRAGPGSSAGSLDLTGSPLQATYVQAVATTTTGRRAMQVIRVPQYQDLTLAGAVTASPWNGLTGGIVALDVAGTLDLNGQGVTVDGLGFRGGGGKTQAAGDTQQRFRWDDTTRHASKGEGIAGTPRFVSEKRSPDSGATAAITDLGALWGGYPTGTARTGDYARGAPGTAGGGGAYWSGSSDNGGGGGGGNGGPGGRGGAGWRSGGYGGILPDYSNLVDKKWGFGGSGFLAAGMTRVVLGGGGGAGDNNNNSVAAQSSGAAGGGIVMLRVGRLIGAGTLSARGARAADNPLNDGAGGGGAGGSVVVVAPLWEVTSLTVNAQGGRGGDAWPTGGAAHGTGGGGGGGVVITSGPATVDVVGGASGVTTTADSPPGGPAHGAEAGASGFASVVAAADDTPGSTAGYRCQIDLSLTKLASLIGPEPGDEVVYHLEITNLSPAPASGVQLGETLPAGLLVLTTSGCAEDPGGVPVCTVGTIPALATATVTVTAEVLGQPLGTVLTNSAGVAGDQADPNLADNSASVGITVSGLVLSKSVCNASAADCGDPVNFVTSLTGVPGDVLEYRVTFERFGPPVFDLELADDVPPEAVFVIDAYGPGQDVVVTCPDGSTGFVSTGPVSVVAFDLTDACALDTATRADGVTVSQALLPGQAGTFRFRVAIP